MPLRAEVWGSTQSSAKLLPSKPAPESPQKLPPIPALSGGSWQGVPFSAVFRLKPGGRSQIGGTSWQTLPSFPALLLLTTGKKETGRQQGTHHLRPKSLNAYLGWMQSANPLEDPLSQHSPLKTWGLVNTSGIPFRTFPSKSSHLSKLSFPGKKKSPISEEEFQKALCFLGCYLSCLCKWKAPRTSYCVMFLASLANCLPSSALNSSGAMGWLQQRSAIVECALFGCFRVVQPENKGENCFSLAMQCKLLVSK